VALLLLYQQWEVTGGATAEGQTHVLEELGITQEAMGYQIVSSMDVVKVGVTAK